MELKTDTWAMAKICWVSPEAGGRKTLPSGPRYSTVARFDRLRVSPEEAWSIVAEFVGSIDEERCVLAQVRFLVPQAPHELLSAGSSFELFEGSRLVARGTVLGGEVAHRS